MLLLNKTHLWIAFGATLFLILFHYLSPWLAKKLPDGGNSYASFTGGVAVAYVFLDMLPNLVEYNKPIGEFLLQHKWLTPFTELSIYIVAVSGFLFYYGLEILAVRHQRNDNNNLVYYLHLLTFCLYNFLITYTMSLKALVSTTAVILFTFAMALHFVLTDRKFERLYPIKFNHAGRFVLILSLLVGWSFSVLFDPVNVLQTAFMTAFLAGSILLNAFREELPTIDLTNFTAFTLGVVLISSILLLHTFVLTHATA